MARRLARYFVGSLSPGCACRSSMTWRAYDLARAEAELAAKITAEVSPAAA
jgi:hypothetical protein